MTHAKQSQNYLHKTFPNLKNELTPLPARFSSGDTECHIRGAFSLDGLSVGDEDSRVDLVAVDVDRLPLLPTAIKLSVDQRTKLRLLRLALNAGLKREK